MPPDRDPNNATAWKPCDLTPQVIQKQKSRAAYDVGLQALSPVRWTHAGSTRHNTGTQVHAREMSL